MPFPTIKVREHNFQSNKDWRGLTCQHCQATWESDLGGPGFSDDKYCNDRLIKDPLLGLTKEEYSFYVDWKGFRYDPLTELWNKPFESETYTTQELKNLISVI